MVRTLLSVSLCIATIPGHSLGQDSFPFVLDDTPAIGPGPAGAWDAGGVFAPRVVRTPEGYLLLYIGQARTGSFDNRLALGVATSVDGQIWEKSAGNPILVPEDLHPGATGVEAPAMMGHDAGELHLLMTAVDAKRSPLSWHEVRINVGDSHVEVGRAVSMTRPSAGAWNDRFPLPEGVADFPGERLLLGSGCCGEGVWMIGVLRLTGARLVWQPDPVLGPRSEEYWDSQQVFGPHVFARSGVWVMLYSGAPGAAGADVLQHTIGYASSGDGLAWSRPPSDNRLIKPRPGQLIEHPFLLAGEGGDRLFVSVKPHPVGVHAIFTGRGRFVLAR